MRYFIFIILTSTLFIRCTEPESRCTLNVTILRHALIGTDQLSAVIIDGEGPFSFNWSTGATNGFINFDTSITMYSVTVTDFSGCSIVDTYHATACSGLISFENRVYGQVSLDSTCWFSANTNSRQNIPEVRDPKQWSNTSTPAWCYYDNISTDTLFYSKLYNWHAANSGKLCPSGYHIPTLAEWQSLIESLGGTDIAGKEMKSSFLWSLPFVGVTDSEFNAIPNGVRLSDGAFNNKRFEAHFWTSTETLAGSDEAYSIYLKNSDLTVSIRQSSKTSGMSCRCIKD